jgi:Tol biopolymer transport system component
MFAMNTKLSVAIYLVLLSTTSGCWKHKNSTGSDADIAFSVSPQGDLLVFNAKGQGGRDLYLLDLKKKHVTRISKSPECECEPSFSPDGKLIAFVDESPADTGNHVYVQSVDGKNRRQLTTGYVSDTSPAFSPDGSLLVFSRSKSYNHGGLAARWNAGEQLCVIKADGSGLRRIDTNGLYVIDPRFSPDGKQIVFWEPGGLYLVAVHGRDKPRPVDGLKGRQASFSPDGRLLLYGAGRYEREQRIFVARADGSAARVVAGPETDPNLPGGCYRPAFASDGRRFLFLCNSRPEGPRAAMRCSLWEAGIEGGAARELVKYESLDDPLTHFPRMLDQK